MTADFGVDKVRGEAAERRLDKFFGRSFLVYPVTDGLQRVGVDRVFVGLEGGVPFWVEYKTDWRAAQTGNAFVETVSVDVQNVPGWAYTSQALHLAYYVPGLELVYWWEMARLRAELFRWERWYPARRIANRGYNTVGVLVPLAEFEQYAEVLSL